MSEDTIRVVKTILNEHKACIQHEITDRAWIDFKQKSRSVTYAIDMLYSIDVIRRQKVESPYGKPFHFYYLPNIDSIVLSDAIDYKLDLLMKHSSLTEEIGYFGEKLVASVIKRLCYDEVETRKMKLGKIGINRRDIDVWGKHPYDYYHNIEVKNRRQPVNVNDVEDVKLTTDIALESWDLPIVSAIVCSFILKKAKQQADSYNIPCVITKNIFVPERYADFYLEYRKALGSYYIEIVNPEEPHERLQELFETYVFHHEY